MGPNDLRRCHLRRTRRSALFQLRLVHQPIVGWSPQAPAHPRTLTTSNDSLQTSLIRSRTSGASALAHRRMGCRTAAATPRNWRCSTSRTTGPSTPVANSPRISRREQFRAALGYVRDLYADGRLLPGGSAAQQSDPQDRVHGRQSRGHFHRLDLLRAGVLGPGPEALRRRLRSGRFSPSASMVATPPGISSALPSA